MKITKTSAFSGKEHTMDLPITQEELDRWHRGELIQNVFPHLNPSQREFLITGTTPEEWNDMFKEDGEDEEDNSNKLDVFEINTQEELNQFKRDLDETVDGTTVRETDENVIGLRAYAVHAQAKLNAQKKLNNMQAKGPTKEKMTDNDFLT